MNLTEIFLKLVGEIEPSEKRYEDEIRFENLKVICELVNNLVIKIDNVAYVHKDSKKHSAKRSSEFAQNFLKNTLGIS